MAFLGCMFAYFISFVIGQFLATCLGIVFFFWPIVGPEIKSYQRNWELTGGRDLVDVWMDDDDDDDVDGINDRDGKTSYNDYIRTLPEDKRGLYGAYYISRIVDVCVVDDVRATRDEEYDLSEFMGYTQASDEMESITGIPWKVRLRLTDDAGRGMQVHSRMSEEYLGICPGMTAVGVLLSTSKRFTKLAGITDFCILDVVLGNTNDDDSSRRRRRRRGNEGGGVANVKAITWVGDYPYLDKAMFLRTLNENGISDRVLDNYFDTKNNDDDGCYDYRATEVDDNTDNDLEEEDEKMDEYITNR